MDYIWAKKLPVNTIFYKLFNKQSFVQWGISFTSVAKLGLHFFYSSFGTLEGYLSEAKF
jgi:hypothetical protein